MNSVLPKVKQSIAVEVIEPKQVGDLREAIAATATEVAPRPKAASDCPDEDCTWPNCQTLKKDDRPVSCYRGLPATEV